MRAVSACIAIVFLAGTVSPAAAECRCRARGVLAAEGQTLCIPTPQGTRLARCSKVSNVASWTFLDGPCPQAELQPAGSPALVQGSNAIR